MSLVKDKISWIEKVGYSLGDFSANNLPYSSLSGVMTGNMSERNSISSYRFTAVTVSILPMLTFFASVACLFYYEIDKNKEIQIQEELEIRRKNNNHNKHQLLRA